MGVPKSLGAKSRFKKATPKPNDESTKKETKIKNLNRKREGFPVPRRQKPGAEATRVLPRRRGRAPPPPAAGRAQPRRPPRVPRGRAGGGAGWWRISGARLCREGSADHKGGNWRETFKLFSFSKRATWVREAGSELLLIYANPHQRTRFKELKQHHHATCPF